MASEVFNQLVVRLQKAIDSARRTGCLLRSPEAEELWCSVYAELSAEHPEPLGSITSRSEAQVLRLSLIYALLDGSNKIEFGHLQAALAAWDYCFASAQYIFGGLAHEVARRDAAKIEDVLANCDGFRSFRELASRNSMPEVRARAAVLASSHKLTIREDVATGGRPSSGVALSTQP